MVVTKDLGEGMHPRNRVPYAQRMVLWARHIAYGEDMTYSGPIVESATPEGTRVRIRFRAGTADGLHALPPYPPQGFALSEEGQFFDWAQAEIDGTDVVVWNDRMPAPTQVRYAWHEKSRWANLVNGEEMPAAPFDLPVAISTTTASSSSSTTSSSSPTTTTSETTTSTTTSTTVAEG
jgi:sialate O-acetylesterase